MTSSHFFGILLMSGKGSSERNGAAGSMKYNANKQH